MPLDRIRKIEAQPAAFQFQIRLWLPVRHNVYPLSKTRITFKSILTGYPDLCYDITTKYSLAGYAAGVK